MRGRAVQGAGLAGTWRFDSAMQSGSASGRRTARPWRGPGGRDGGPWRRAQQGRMSWEEDGTERRRRQGRRATPCRASRPPPPPAPLPAAGAAGAGPARRLFPSPSPCLPACLPPLLQIPARDRAASRGARDGQAAGRTPRAGQAAAAPVRAGRSRPPRSIRLISEIRAAGRGKVQVDRPGHEDHKGQGTHTQLWGHCARGPRQDDDERQPPCPLWDHRPVGRRLGPCHGL